ncbi:MAG: hypothetical protein ACT4OG_02390 [Alphaproteobacteria bacterium]
MQRLYEAANRAEPSIATVIRRSLGNPECYERLTACPDLIQCAHKLGIAAPVTHAIGSQRELERHLVSASYPVVLKADGSWSGERIAVAHGHDEAIATYRRLASLQSRWRNLVRAAARGDRASLYTAVHRQERGCSLQSCVGGAQATTAFACWQGNLLASIHLDVVVAQNDTGPAPVVRRAESADMENAARRIARRFRLSGLHGLDFVRGTDGKPQLVAMHPRAVQGSYLPFGPAHDLAAALVAAATRSEVAARPAIAENEVAFFPGEWRRDPASPHLITAFHDVPWDDPDVLRDCLGFPRNGRAAPGKAASGAALTLGGKSELIPLRHTS